MQREYEISGTFQHCTDRDGVPPPTVAKAPLAEKQEDAPPPPEKTETRSGYTTDDVDPVAESDFATPVPSVSEEEEEVQLPITVATAGSAGWCREQTASDAQIGGWFTGQHAQVCCRCTVAFKRWKWNCLVVLILLFQVSHDQQSLSWPHQATVSKPAAFICSLH